MNKEEVLNFSKKVMSEKCKKYVSPAWFPEDDDQDETLESLLELEFEGKIRFTGGHYIDQFFII